MSALAQAIRRLAPEPSMDQELLDLVAMQAETISAQREHIKRLDERIARLNGTVGDKWVI